MEKAILKTLIYADLFDYPLLAYEIHKWLIGKQVSLRQVEKALERLRVKGRVERVKGYFVLSGRKELIKKRVAREKQSKKYFLKVKIMTWFLKFIPWIKLVGISDKKDDIDLFLITAKDRLWLSRLLVCSILDFWGVCVSSLLEEDKLEQETKDIYVAHEVLQMKPLWFRDKVYQKYLQDNTWVFEFLPNWIGTSDSSLRGRLGDRGNLDQTGKIASSLTFLAMTIEGMAKRFQLKVMQKAQGMEGIQDGAVDFHPNDIRLEILQKYKDKLKTIP